MCRCRIAARRGSARPGDRRPLRMSSHALFVNAGPFLRGSGALLEAGQAEELELGPGYGELLRRRLRLELGKRLEGLGPGDGQGQQLRELAGLADIHAGDFADDGHVAGRGQDRGIESAAAGEFHRGDVSGYLRPGPASGGRGRGEPGLEPRGLLLGQHGRSLRERGILKPDSDLPDQHVTGPAFRRGACIVAAGVQEPEQDSELGLRELTFTHRSSSCRAWRPRATCTRPRAGAYPWSSSARAASSSLATDSRSPDMVSLASSKESRSSRSWAQVRYNTTSRDPSATRRSTPLEALIGHAPAG